MNNYNGIHAFVYNNKRHPVGVLAAAPRGVNPKEVIVGWSRCNYSAGDSFSKREGTRIAYERSLKGSNAYVPDSMYEDYQKFVLRARRYFKDCIVEG